MHELLICFGLRPATTTAKIKINIHLDHTRTISGVGEAVDQVLVASERVHHTPITAVIHLQGRGAVGSGRWGLELHPVLALY